jgi:hypothetical protein
MGRKLVNNPIKTVVFEVPEEVKEKIAFLEMELVKEKAIKRSGIKEVIKIEEKIIYKDDPSLIARLNQTLKELGELKQQSGKVVYLANAKPSDPVVKEVIKEVVKEVQVKTLDKKKLVCFCLIAYTVGALSTFVIERLIGYPFF